MLNACGLMVEVWRCLRSEFESSTRRRMAYHITAGNRAKVAAVAATPGCSQAHNLGHSKECLPAQHNFAAQHNFVAHHRNSVAQHNSMVQRNLVTQLKCFTWHNFEV